MHLVRYPSHMDRPLTQDLSLMPYLFNANVCSCMTELIKIKIILKNIGYIDPVTGNLRTSYLCVLESRPSEQRVRQHPCGPGQ